MSAAFLQIAELRRVASVIIGAPLPLRHFAGIRRTRRVGTFSGSEAERKRVEGKG